jgi:hypothetical protein
MLKKPGRRGRTNDGSFVAFCIDTGRSPASPEQVLFDLNRTECALAGSGAIPG